MKNIIESKWSEEDKAAFNDLLKQMETLIKNKMVSLTAEERAHFGSVNEQSKLLINKTRDFRINDPTLSSPDIDWEKFESDYQARRFIESATLRLDSISSQFKSTKILHDYDNRQDSLKDYSYSKYKINAGESGFTQKVAQIQQFFPNTGKRKTRNED